MAEPVFLVLMLLLAVLALNAGKLRVAVVYLGVFSLVSSFVYLLYSAPDVAIAEAVIGTGIAVVLYLVALKKYHVFTIYHTSDAYEQIDDRTLRSGSVGVLRDVERFLTDRELEVQTIYTVDDPEEVLARGNHDLVVHRSGNRVILYGYDADYHLDAVERFLSGRSYGSLTIQVIRRSWEVGT